MNQFEISPEINQRILDSLEDSIKKLSSPSNKFLKKQVSFGENPNNANIINTSPRNIINSSITNSNNMNNLNDAIIDYPISTGNDNSPSKVHSTTSNKKTILDESKKKKGPINYEFEINALKEKYEKTKKELVEVTRKISEQEKILQKTKNKRKGIDKKYKENCLKTKEMEMKVDYLYEKLKQSEIIRTEQQKLIMSLRLEYTELKKFFPNYKGIDDTLNITDDNDFSNSDDSNSFEIKFDQKIIDTETGDESQTNLNINNSNFDFSKGDILNIKNEGLTSIAEDEGEDSVSKLKNELGASKKNSKGSKTNSINKENSGNNLGSSSGIMINNNDSIKANNPSPNNVINTNAKVNSSKASSKNGSKKGGSVHGSSKNGSVKASNKK